MVNNVLRDFKAHAKRAEIQFHGKFTIHTFQKICAQNWADYLPANVVKFYLGHSKVETTNRFYSIVDESHAALTKQAMDKMLNGKTQNVLDTGWTLEGEISRDSASDDNKEKPDSSINSSHKNTSDSSDKWAIQDLNL